MLLLLELTEVVLSVHCSTCTVGLALFPCPCIVCYKINCACNFGKKIQNGIENKFKHIFKWDSCFLQF